jgi:hypothetical protein
MSRERALKPLAQTQKVLIKMFKRFTKIFIFIHCPFKGTGSPDVLSYG